MSWSPTIGIDIDELDTRWASWFCGLGCGGMRASFFAFFMTAAALQRCYGHSMWWSTTTARPSEIGIRMHHCWWWNFEIFVWIICLDRAYTRGVHAGQTNIHIHLGSHTETSIQARPVYVNRRLRGDANCRRVLSIFLATQVHRKGIKSLQIGRGAICSSRQDDFPGTTDSLHLLVEMWKWREELVHTIKWVHYKHLYVTYLREAPLYYQPESTSRSSGLNRFRCRCTISWKSHMQQYIFHALRFVR